MLAASGDPLAVGLVAAMSLTVLVGLCCLNQSASVAGPTSVSCAPTQGAGWVENLHPIDHDCPVVLSVIRR